MKYLILLFLLLQNVAHAQEDVWETYLAMYDAHAGSVMVNMSLHENNKLAGLPYLVVTGPHSHKSDTAGFPEKSEMRILDEILDLTDIIISSKTNYVVAGTFTYQGTRQNHYYVADTTNIRNAIAKAYTDKYREYKYVLNISEDRKAESYYTFLYPTEELFEHIQNTKVVLSLLKQGDNPNIPRETNHWLYFKSEKGMNEFISYVKNQNYTVVSSEKTNGDHPYKLNIKHTTAVSDNIITPITIRLKREAANHEGLYDGWETAVTKE